ncbi:MAG: FecR family protein, partial [Spirochaetota bacterium]
MSCSKLRFRSLLAVAALASFTWATPAVYAQTEPRAVLEYFEDEFEVEITDADGIPRDVFLGQALFPGDFIQTFDSTVELRLEPNGTIIKVGSQTAFAIDSIQGREGADRSTFDLSVGRIRAVAARAGGSAYEFRTPFAVGGVRGTDFVLDVVPNRSNAIFVRSGGVEFTNLTTGESVLVSEGQGADVFAEIFGADPIPADQLRSLFDSLEFQALEPLDVNPPEDEPPSDTETADPEPGGTEEEPQASDQSRRSPDPTVGNVVTDRFLEFARLEAGSVLLDGRTYGKLVVQPEIRRDRFALGFYVPIVYSDNLFDATSWYRPGGNNEWSFGADQDWGEDPWGALGDLATDAALKVRYARYGEQGDPFFAKVGNLTSMTLGHGILVHDYANDWDFPATRRIGLNLGIDRVRNGVEILVNDLLHPALYGARFY